MKKKGNVFPDGFLWGGATGATQYEGGFDQGGRGPSNFDYMCRIPDAKEKNIRDISELTEERYYYNKAHENALHFPYRKAVDFYGHYKEDIALMAEMGFKVFRMSISWSRIYPTGEEAYPNKEGIQFYHNVFDELRKYQIEPLVTMTHYELPAALVEKYNGWQSERLIDLFVKYAKTLIDEYKDKVKYWITFNEINALICHPYASGGFFVERTDKNYFSAIYQALHHQYVASALAVKYLHETAPDCKMGSMIARLECYPYTCKPTDVAAAFLEDQINYFSFDIMEEHIMQELNYIRCGDYYIPDIRLPEDNRPIGRWGRMHRDYIKEHNPIRFNDLCLSGELWTYLADLNEQAQKRLELIIEQMKAAESVTDGMKEADQMTWVEAMNSIRHRVEEIILREMIYEEDAV